MLSSIAELPLDDSEKLYNTGKWVASTVKSGDTSTSRRNSIVTEKKTKRKSRRRRSLFSENYMTTQEPTPFSDGAITDSASTGRRESLKLPAINYQRTSLHLFDNVGLKASNASMINILGSDQYSEDEHHEDEPDNDNNNNNDSNNDGENYQQDHRKDSSASVMTNSFEDHGLSSDAKGGENNNNNNNVTNAKSTIPTTTSATTTSELLPSNEKSKPRFMKKIPEIRTSSDNILSNLSVMPVPINPNMGDVALDSGDTDKQKERRKKLVREDAKDLEDENILHIVTPKTMEEGDAMLKPSPATSRKLAGTGSPNHPTVRFYNKVCKKLGVLPLRKVMAQFGRSHLSFRNLTLTTKDMKAVCLALQKEPFACSLDFTGNFMGVKELDYILSVLRRQHTVFQVSVCNNCLSGQAVHDLCNFLLTNDFIARLDLSGNKLNDKDAQPVTEILRKNRTLKTLVLNHNEFREEGGTLLGLAIAENNTLEDLDLSWNHLRRCGAVGVAKGLQANTALRTVNLAWNGFGFEGCVAIGDMLCNNYTITELNLAYNRINPPALLELLRGVAGNRTLRILRIGYNPITAAFSSLILAVVQKHKESGLENIDMAGVVVDKEFVALLEEIQKDRFFIVNYEVSLPVKKISREEMREKIGLPAAYNVDPLRMLYLLKEKMRASDFFYKINKDHDDGLQRDELYSLFDEAGIPVTGSVIDKIMEFMDTNGDGTIDLTEFLQGDKRIKIMSRKQIRDEQERRVKDASYTKYSRTFQKAHIDPITNALKVDPSSTPMRQSRRPSVAKSGTESEADDPNHLKIP